ncbi:lectizyme-like [Calliphora vicina]|uniref:lectizyme-like n=1 Tax=Calliphora vicina TaxID=7373 RepID=UPI00325C0CA4
MKVLIVLCALAISAAYAGNFNSLQKLLVPQERVIKGHDAEPHSAPYIISLTLNTTSAHNCGGTIINKEWIVTAAHCITVNPVGMGVVAGLHVRGELNEATQQRVIDFGRVHESYGGSVGPYDIALLHVSKAFDFNEYVQPATLPAREEIPEGNATLYGWGQLKAFNFASAKTLQTVNTQIIDWASCKELMGNNMADTNICSDSFNAGISACNGDSGGPLVIETENAPAELVGVVSWGSIPCGVFNKPSVYTRVSAYVDWVAKIMHAYYVLH